MSPSPDVLLGRLEAQQEQNSVTIAQMQQDITEIRNDMHELKEVIVRLETKVDVLSKQTESQLDPRSTMFSFAILAGAGAGLYLELLGEVSAISMILVAAVLMQKESINRLAKTIFRVNGGRESSTYPTMPDKPA